MHLTVEYPPLVHGGLGTAVGGIVTASAAAGLEVTVLLVSDADQTSNTPGYGQAHPVESLSFDAATVVTTEAATAYAQGLHLIRTRRPDVLHLHVFWLWHLAERLRDQTGVPIVYTAHSLDRAEYEIGHGPPECLTQWDSQAATIHGADRVLALTYHEASLIEQYCPGTRDKTRVVGNGIAACSTITSIRRRPPDRSVQVLFSGRFVDRKGIRDLLTAIPLVLHRAPVVEFIFAGGHRGATSDEMDSWWRPASLDGIGRVRFTGWLDTADMHDWYHRADILVVPSWYEPFGMVILEGMQHGLAIAAAAVGGPAAILARRRTGLLFPPRNPRALAAALLELIQDPPQRIRVASRARYKLGRTWTWDHILPNAVNTYAELGHDGAAAA